MQVEQSWSVVNLADLGERPAVRPRLGDVGLIYPGKRHVFSGPQEAAKTLAAYALGLEEIRDGGRVLLIDFEMGQWDARDRLREMGAADEELAAFVYVEPDESATKETVADLLALKPTLVIVDAAAGAYDLQGLDDNKRADVERFARLYVRPFWQKGIATILLDHVVKNADARGKYAIGSERKVGGADVHLGFEVIRPLSRGGRGVYKLTTHKDRGGLLPRPTTAELEIHSDPETHALTWTFRSVGGERAESDGFRPTVLMERVSKFLEWENEPASLTTVEQRVKGKVEYVRAAVDQLVDEGYVAETSGPRRARIFSFVKPFRADQGAEA
jgi:GNAT superfamily N-acetyltransferase